jgi:hypothetical protein
MANRYKFSIEDEGVVQLYVMANRARPGMDPGRHVLLEGCLTTVGVDGAAHHENFPGDFFAWATLVRHWKSLVTRPFI